MHKQERTIKAGNETMTVSGHDPVPEPEWEAEYQAEEEAEREKVADHRVDVDAHRKYENSYRHGSHRR